MTIIQDKINFDVTKLVQQDKRYFNIKFSIVSLPVPSFIPASSSSFKTLLYKDVTSSRVKFSPDSEKVLSAYQLKRWPGRLNFSRDRFLLLSKLSNYYRAYIEVPG